MSGRVPAAAARRVRLRHPRLAACGAGQPDHGRSVVYPLRTRLWISDSLAVMHRSRLVGILIDTPAAQVGAEVDFWSAALGVPTFPAPGEEQYTVLINAAPGLITVVQ